MFVSGVGEMVRGVIAEHFHFSFLKKTIEFLNIYILYIYKFDRK